MKHLSPILVLPTLAPLCALPTSCETSDMAAFGAVAAGVTSNMAAMNGNAASAASLASARDGLIAEASGSSAGTAGGTTGSSYPASTTPTYTVANKIPGKEGFVYSPYTGKMVDVSGIAGGTLVQDPTYSGTGKGYFRVPGKSEVVGTNANMATSNGNTASAGTRSNTPPAIPPAPKVARSSQNVTGIWHDELTIKEVAEGFRHAIPPLIFKTNQSHHQIPMHFFLRFVTVLAHALLAFPVLHAQTSIDTHINDMSSVTSGALPDAVIGQSYSFIITGSNSPTYYFTDGLWDGLSLNRETGVISGIPSDPKVKDGYDYFMPVTIATGNEYGSMGFVSTTFWLRHAGYDTGETKGFAPPSLTAGSTLKYAGHVNDSLDGESSETNTVIIASTTTFLGGTYIYSKTGDPHCLVIATEADATAPQEAQGRFSVHCLPCSKDALDADYQVAAGKAKAVRPKPLKPTLCLSI